jgi:purine-nucleoside phosphorylase
MSVSFDVELAAGHLRSRIGHVPDIGIVLGSGLGQIVDRVEAAAVVPFEEVPGYPTVGVVGHAGRYVTGRLGDADVLLQCGRFHRYEGHADEVLAAPVRVAAALGVHTLILTNAAGAIRADLEAGAIVLLEDHINCMSWSPLRGPVRRGEERFPDMSRAYDERLREVAREAAAASNTSLKEGVYAAVPGPSYETPAEVRMLARLGADMVGMSTVPEVIVARALGLRCLAFSVVTNKAAGLGDAPLRHDEVIETGQAAGARLADLLTRVVEAIAGGPYSVSAK